MKKGISVILSMLLVYFSYGQSFEWVNVHGGSGWDEVGEIHIDKDGSILAIGIFESSVDFDPGDSQKILISNGASDLFLQKLNSDGDLLWVTQFGGSGFEYFSGIDTDAEGNIFVVGGFANSVDFDPGEDEYILTTDGNDDAFVVKLSPDGELIWAKQIGGDNDQWGRKALVDSEGNVVIAGSFRGTVDFNPNEAVFNLPSSGNYDNFILKLDYNGNFLWAKSFGGVEWDFISEVAFDSEENIIAVGFFEGSADFDPSEEVFEVTATSYTDAFVLKLDSEGIFKWIKPLANPDNETGYAVTIDENNNIYVTGNFYGSVTYDNIELTAIGEQDIIILKILAEGTIDWAKSMGGFSNDYGISIATNGHGSLYSTGFYSEVVDMDPNEETFNLSSVNGSGDIYLHKLTTNGDFEWAISIGGDEFEWGTFVTATPQGEIFLGGSFESDFDFDFTEGEYFVESINGGDAFLLKINDPLPLGADKKIDEITLFPIPATNKLNIRSDNFIVVNATLMSLTGNVIHSWILYGDTEVEIPDNVPPGTYLLQLTNKQGNQSTYRFIKQ